MLLLRRVRAVGRGTASIALHCGHNERSTIVDVVVVVPPVSGTLALCDVVGLLAFFGPMCPN